MGCNQRLWTKLDPRRWAVQSLLGLASGLHVQVTSFIHCHLSSRISLPLRAVDSFIFSQHQLPMLEGSILGALRNLFIIPDTILIISFTVNLSTSYCLLSWCFLLPSISIAFRVKFAGLIFSCPRFMPFSAEPQDTILGRSVTS
jgi:hypothetical protein